MLDINEIKKKYGTETALIIICCRVFFGSASRVELSDLIAAAEINWSDFMRLTRMHRVRPIVFKIIADLAIPEDIKATIRQKQLELIKQNLKVAAETERVILLLQQAGIKAIPYKGVAYSKQFFGDLVSREISDIDLVIRQQDLAESIKTLNANGYTGEVEDIHQFLGSIYFRYFKDYNLNKSRNGEREFHVELHWAITENEIGVNSKARTFLYDTRHHEILAKNPILTLTPLSHFSAMLIHNTFKDNLALLKNIVDIAGAMKLPEVQHNTGLLINSFSELGIRKSLSVNNRLCEQLLGVSLPQIVDFGDSVQVSDYFMGELCSRPSLSVTEKENITGRIKSTAMLQDSFSKKMQFYWLCVRFRFIPGRFDFRFVQLPGPLFFLYYFIKPFRTLIKPSDGNPG